MKTINIDTLIKFLGEPEKQLGNEYIWQCPYCKDSSRDNLKFNTTKGILWCFANENHAPKILGDIFKNKKGAYIFKSKGTEANDLDRHKEIFSISKQLEFRAYMKACNNRLMCSETYLTSLMCSRGISSATAKRVKLGIDLNKKRWVIPTFPYSTEHSKYILGFEYRPLNFSKIGLTREKYTPTGLAMINSYSKDTEALVIVEGYFDGYALLQYLIKNKQDRYYHIVTPSNGVTSLLKFIPQIQFTKYKKFYLYIDNDDAGNRVACKILEKYPMFDRLISNYGCKDFNEYYLKYVKMNG